MPHAMRLQSDSLVNNLLLAQNFATERNVGEITTIDMVFALVTANTFGSIILKALLRKQPRVEDFGKVLAGSVRIHDFITDEEPTFSRPAGQVIITTNKIALQRGVRNREGSIEVGSDHLLVALTEVEEADSRAFLSHFGINASMVRNFAFN